ncbi:hypothetical protein RCL_jg17915.t1 [Rhizophagus clarus]|uniref:Uncharacterized protein n=1 Tax=Rhizophagus clarus TaxID=94130 RepID=A0A8H3L8I2_9GLOM|nr:hypothetical protein RCL_jg17915.t1 [Rhizophagus clarus]
MNQFFFYSSEWPLSKVHTEGGYLNRVKQKEHSTDYNKDKANTKETIEFWEDVKKLPYSITNNYLWNRRENALKKRRTGRGGRILILRKRRKSSMLKAHPSDSYVEESKKISDASRSRTVHDIKKIWNTTTKKRNNADKLKKIKIERRGQEEPHSSYNQINGST